MIGSITDASGNIYFNQLEPALLGSVQQLR
jgi:hypothetical protein